MDIKIFKLLANYNIWATRNLTHALEEVSDQDFFQNQGLFFKSIFGTLNHLLVGEHYLWFPRFNAQIVPALSLDTLIEKDRSSLLQELENKSYRWLDFLEHIDTQCFDQDLHYQSSAGQAISPPYAQALLHVFNHGTHHRGQITAALTAMGYTCPALDIIYMLLEMKEKHLNF